MPCYDPRDNQMGGVRTIYEKGHDPEAAREVKRLTIEVNRLSSRCAEMTDLLCKVGRARRNKTEIPKEVLKWWDEHAKLDRKHGEPW